MSRTSKALRRLGVPGLAAATLVAGVPAFLGAASAAPGDTITLSPDNATAASGTCVVFTATVANATTNPSGRLVDIVLTESGIDNEATGTPSALGTEDASFCTTSATGDGADTNTGFNGATGVAGPNPNPGPVNSTTAADTDRGQFAADADGVVRFGVRSTTGAQTVNVRAFIEDDQNNTFNEGEVNDTSVVTFTQGGDNSVTTVDAEPEARNGFVGEPIEFTITASNTNSNTVAGADIAGEIVSGGTGTFACDDNGGQDAGNTGNVGTTNNNGVTTCTFTPNGAGTYQLRFFADETGRRNGQFDTGEANDLVTATVQAAPAGLVVTLQAQTPAGTANDVLVNDPSEPAGQFVATVRDAQGNPVSNTLVRFTLTDSNVDNGGTANNDDLATRNPVEAFTNAAGQAVVTITEPAPLDGETITVTATVAGQAAGAGTSDVAQLVFNEANVNEARFIDLTPESSTQTVGTFEVTALVTDRFGNPVTGVPVTFTETGDARFTNGTSSVTALTGPTGRASAALESTGAGTSTVIASFPENGESNDSAEAATANTPAVAAGTDSDSETYNIAAATASPTPTTTVTPGPVPTQTVTATPTPTVTNTAGTGLRQLVLDVQNDTITPGVQGVVVITGTPNRDIEVLAYSRPSTTYNVVRRVSLGEDGTATIRILPGTNTRLYARYVGVANSDSQSVVQNVATALSLTVVRNGSRDYTFQGRILPRRAGQLITLYRVLDDGREIITSQIRTDNTGTYRIRRVFTGSGTFGFLTRTGQNLTNVAGVSNGGQARPTAIYAGPQR